MSEKVKQALDAFGEGYNCAQAVIAAFAGSLGMDRETALRFAGGFGGGLRSGEVCGAISGAVMAIGLKYGQTDAADKATKEQCNRMTIRFMDQVRKEQGTVLCRDLLGYDARPWRRNANARSATRPSKKLSLSWRTWVSKDR